MAKGTHLLIAASVMMTFLGSGYNPQEVNVKPVVAENDEYKNENVYETEAWEKVAERWNSTDKVTVEDFEQIYDIVKKEKEDMGKILETLVSDGYFSGITGDAINQIYGENLTVILESKVVLPCCYAPMPPPPEWDCRGIDTRDELNKKLDLVEGLYETGTVEKEVLDNAKKDILQRISLLDSADEYWQKKGEGTLEDHPYEIDLLLHLYDQNLGGIKEGADVQIDLIEASEYISELEK